MGEGWLRSVGPGTEAADVVIFVQRLGFRISCVKHSSYKVVYLFKNRKIEGPLGFKTSWKERVGRVPFHQMHGQLPSTPLTTDKYKKCGFGSHIRYSSGLQPTHSPPPLRPPAPRAPIAAINETK